MEKNVEELRNAYLTIARSMTEDDLLRTGYSLIASKPFVDIGYGSGLHLTFGDGNITQSEKRFNDTMDAFLTNFHGEEKISGMDYIGAFLQSIMECASLRTRIKLLLAAGYGSNNFNPIHADTPVDFDISIHESDIQMQKELEELKNSGVTLLDLFKEMWSEISKMRGESHITYNPFLTQIIGNIVRHNLKIVISVDEATFAETVVDMIEQ